ncbi:MAG: hypothetical protein QOF76_1898, partial [Solirubrobacteraceae bacterium]|nr:hypothetical protein [Solirubrobacteraceae bacterium]
AFATIEFDAEASFVAAMIAFIGAFVAGRAGITDDDAAAWVAEQQALGARGEFFFATTQFCFTATKPQ